MTDPTASVALGPLLYASNDAEAKAFERELDAVWRELTAAGARYEVAPVELRGQVLRHYPAAWRNVREFWLATAGFADRDYLIYGSERITYAQAHRLSGAIAAWLHDRGVRRGDRVAIAMRNYPEWMLIYWACVSSGVVAVGMNAWWVAEEMAHGLRDARPKVLFCDAERLAQRDRWRSVNDTVLVAVRVDAARTTGSSVVDWAEVIAHPGDLPDVDIDPDDDACIFYTSGTTGLAKGARLSHRGCVTSTMNLAFVTEAHRLADARCQGSAAAGALSAEPAAPPVGLVTTPLFHVTANNGMAYSVTASGGRLVLMRKWDPSEALRLIEAERVTNMSGVPTMARELLNHEAASRHDLSSLAVVGMGGAPMPPDLVLRIGRSDGPMIPATGYGMTEACGAITATVGKPYTARPQSCGRLLPTFEARVVDDDDRDVAPGAAGELCVKGACVINGYLNQPEASERTIVDGWLHTGDVARIDDQGYVYILDRKKDMVLRGGENVYCAEVEAALYRHPGVAEACVFALPDERLGEDVAAAVVFERGVQGSVDELRATVGALIARHKVPRWLWILDEPLPRNANGKFLRRQLRDRLRPSGLASGTPATSTIDEHHDHQRFL